MMKKSISAILIDEKQKRSKQYSSFLGSVGCIPYQILDFSEVESYCAELHFDIAFISVSDEIREIQSVVNFFKRRHTKVVLISHKMKIPILLRNNVAYFIENELTPYSVTHIFRQLFDIDLKPRRVFLVDDSPTIIKILKKLLEARGYVVGSAYTGQEALEKLEPFDPDIITLDYSLPDMNGIDLCIEIRKNPVFRDHPIFMLTVEENEAIQRAAFEAGIFDFFIKRNSSAVFVEYLDTYFKLRSTFNEPAKVLVIEDSKTICEVINKFILSANLDSKITNSAEEALQYLESGGDADVILCDINLPQMNGLEFIRKVRKLGFTKKPVIMMTANRKETTLVRSFLYGANDYIQKPFERDELLVRLKSLIRLSSLQKEVLVKNEYLEELNRTKNKFIGMATHDLRNPLTTIRNSAELMLGGYYKDEKSLKSMNNVILDEVIKMLKILDDLLCINQIEEGNIKIQKKKVKISDILAQLSDNYAISANKKDTQLKLVDRTNNACLWIDPDRIIQVVENYLSNAIKYSESGTCVTIESYIKNNAYRFEVHDQGVGILAEEHGQVFLRYGKISSAPTHGEGSVGLGLSICKAFIESHGGIVGFTSSEGKGSIFFFEIPDCIAEVD